MASMMLKRLVGSSVDLDSSSTTALQEENWKIPHPSHLPQVEGCSSTSQLEGGQLFEAFVFDQLSKNKVVSPHVNNLLDLCTRAQQSTSEMYGTAARLFKMAAAFSETDDRQKVKDAALTVSQQMMRQELDVTLETMLSASPDLDDGVIVLFFFCLDLSLRVLEAEHGDVMEVMTWCKRGIDAALGPYVEAHGGWVNVGSSAARMFVTGWSLMSELRNLVHF